MRKILILSVIFGLGLVLAAPVGAITVLNFDDRPASDAGLPSDYGGLTWTGGWYTSGQDYGPDLAAFSPPIRLYATPAGGSIAWPETVNFLGVAVSTGDTTQAFWFEGYVNGAKLFESTHIAGEFRNFVDLSWNVDEVRFVSATPYVIIDNITYGAVPLPPTVWLFGTGLIGLSAWHKYRRKH